VVVAGFGFYAAAVALAPPEESLAHGAAFSGAPEGARAWRVAGCQSCHSLYGLGGHTGPDLTNVVSRVSADYVRTVVRFGMRGMPAYRTIEPAELEAIVAYLADVDRTATFPPRGLTGAVFGER